MKRLEIGIVILVEIGIFPKELTVMSAVTKREIHKFKGLLREANKTIARRVITLKSIIKFLIDSLQVNTSIEIKETKTGLKKILQSMKKEIMAHSRILKEIMEIIYNKPVIMKIVDHKE